MLSGLAESGAVQVGLDLRAGRSEIGPCLFLLTITAK